MHLYQNNSTQRNSSWDVPYTFSGKEKDAETGYSYFGARFPIAIGSSDLSVWLSVDALADKYPSMSAYMYTAGNPVMLVDPDGMKDGWVEDKDGNVTWDNNTNSQEEFNTNYKDIKGYKYVSDADDAKSYTLPSGEGKLVMNKWSASEKIEDGSGHVEINISFIPTDEKAEVGWTQTYSTNQTDVDNVTVWTTLPDENCSEWLDGYGVQQSADVSVARYFDGYTGYGTANPTLDDGPQRVKIPDAQYDVTFYAQSTVLSNGKSVVSLGWGFTVTSQNSQTVQAPTILKTTSNFHNSAVKSLINKILKR